MSASRRAFSRAEIRYLRSLPAVANVTASRITYADAFRDKATERYNAGDSPTRIFREAGLGPEIIGYKRIERAFARWREQPRTTVIGSDAAAYDAGELDVFDVGAAAPKQHEEAEPDTGLRDRLIVEQALRIAELEERIGELEGHVKELECELAAQQESTSATN